VQKMGAETPVSVPNTDATKSPRPRRRLLAPEVIQTSAMDCGPAALKCLLEGFGVPVSYGRLREACQTSVDGTSIDTLETVAGLLGLDAQQIMLPVEHVVAPGADALPAIAVLRLPSGMTHFVVLWRRVGPYLQVMDPARGRRWVRVSALLGDLLVHTQSVDADAFREFVVDAGFREPLAERLRRLLGKRRAAALRPLLDGAAADASWAPMARLDAAARALQSLVAARALRRGAEADRLLRALLEPSAAAAVASVLDAHASAGPVPGGQSGNGGDGDQSGQSNQAGQSGQASPGSAAQVWFKGAVLVRIAGRRAAPSDGASDPLPADLAAALDDRPLALWRTLVALWNPGARKLGFALAVLALLAAVGTIAEVVLARPLLSSNQATAGAGVSSAGLIALCVVVFGLLAFELPLALGARGLGRALDLGLRRAFLRKLPRLGDRYFASRPVSDMAERAHQLHRVRLLPGLAAQLGRAVFELVLTTVAIVWLYPRGAPVAFGLLAVACIVPALGLPVLAERDLRLRTHSGSLMRFYLDALLGLSAVRTHGAERAVVREHDDRLGEWRRAGRDMIRASLTVESVVVAISALGAGVLVMASVDTLPAGPTRAATALLLLFFALGLPMQAARLIALVRQLPDHRNVTLRLIEPLGAPEERSVSDERGVSEQQIASQPERLPVALAFEAVSVEAGGHPVLTNVSLVVEAGAHVAVIGASGAGKSTLIGLLLGFHRPSEGRVLVDGRSLDGVTGELASLRADTVWVEPGVQLWNRSIFDNIAYGTDRAPSAAEVARSLADAELAELVGRLPAGIDTPLGEGGGLLSGGEGQRVRLARELIRVPHPRLVLLDEPFRGLDRGTRLRLLSRVRARWAGATLIAATHDIEHTTTFSRVVIVDAGRIAEDGDPRVLAATEGSRYRGLLDAEARVHQQRWSRSQWRRVVVRDGHVLSND
jgi:ABC-type bacteriocin/lantibiotic exporter with double-glycine peptidase domain